jgi:osmotically inducible lipoprotein OsmB
VKTRESVIASVLALAVLTGLSGRSGMSRRDQNAVAGGVAGALPAHGSAMRTGGGAAVGGVIGNEISTDSNNID